MHMQVIERSPTLRDKALVQLRKAIVAGDLAPASMHSEQAIAQRLGLSRTPVREALLQLASEGLVFFVPNRGARITELDASHLVEVLQFRAAIEGCGASRMAANTDPVQIARLEAELKRQRAIIKKGERLEWVEANADFHSIIAENSDNRLMMEAFGPLLSHTKRLGIHMNKRAQRMQESLDEHSAVVDAIRRGDVDRARTMAEEHLYVTTVLMKQLFADLGLEDRSGANGLKAKRGRNGS